LARGPEAYGHAQSRWTLASLLDSELGLSLHTQGGLSALFKRLKISYQRARDYVHSPDVYYNEKLAQIAEALAQARADPERYIVLYQDEFTYYRQPTLGASYARQGGPQPLAHRSYRPNNWFRITAAMNALTGQVTYRQSSKIGLRQLSQFYAQLRAAYPHAKLIYLVQDNWSIHFHPDVLARLQPQRLPWPSSVPGNWPKEPSPQAVRDNLPIQILSLPTYASWCNPIEKLWRWLNQDRLHLHRQANDWLGLRRTVADFLDQFAAGSQQLLRYTGVLLG
jgi:hypothetical protein